MTQFDTLRRMVLDGDHNQSDPGTDEQLSTILVHALADWEGVCVTELDSLSRWIDLDALDDLFAPTYGGTKRSTGRVSFSYRNQHITVTSDGTVLIESQSEDHRYRVNQNENRQGGN
jgi:hypothetical protein